MKRFLLLLLSLIFVLSLCACSEGNAILVQEYKFPKDTMAAGMDLTGLTKDEAWDALASAVANYTMELTVDGNPITITGEDMDLSCSREVFVDGVAALEAGSQPDFAKLIRFSEAKLLLALNRGLNRNAQNAALVYDEAAAAYVLQPHQEGLRTDHKALSGAIKDAIRNLVPQHSVTGFSEVLMPEVLSDDPAVQTALEQVNKMTVTELSYTFGAGSSNPTVHTIAPETIRTFVNLGEDGVTPSVDMEAITAYAEALAAEHFIPARMDGFRTTAGEELDLVISYDPCQVDAALLADDIRFFVQYGISAERIAPYFGSSNHDMPFGGTYAEVDLNTQHLWFYQEGKLLMDTDLVSGCVDLNMTTPNGVFYVYSRIRSTHLEGPGYRSYVNYWMPFYRGYGLHDATWRDEFGGNIYLDDGSHGCVNLPLENAAILFKNSRSGHTRVIVHGGENPPPMEEQILLGKSEYEVTADAEPFKLNTHSKYVWPDYYYVSDNPQVATVDENGQVTVTGIGTANITVTCTTESIYNAASTTVVVNVQAAEEEAA